MKVNNKKINLRKKSAVKEELGKALSLYKKAIEFYNTDRFAEAKDAFEEALRLNPEFSEIYYVLGLIKKALNDFQGAMNDFNMAIQLKVPHYSNAYYERGLIKYHNLNDPHGALEDYNMAIEIKPSSLYYFSRAITKSKLGDDSGAINDYQLAVKLCAELYYLDGLNDISAENYVKANDNFTKAILLDSTDSNLYSQRGYTRFLLKDFNGSIEDYTKAIELDHEDSGNYYSRANAKVLMNDVDGAVLDYKKVLKINPHHKEALLKLEEIIKANS